MESEADCSGLVEAFGVRFFFGASAASDAGLLAIGFFLAAFFVGGMFDQAAFFFLAEDFFFAVAVVPEDEPAADCLAATLRLRASMRSITLPRFGSLSGVVACGRPSWLRRVRAGRLRSHP